MFLHWGFFLDVIDCRGGDSSHQEFLRRSRMTGGDSPQKICDRTDVVSPVGQRVTFVIEILTTNIWLFKVFVLYLYSKTIKQ